MHSLKTLHRINDRVNSEDRPTYAHIKAERKCQVNEEFAIRVAMGIISSRMRQPGEALTSPQQTIQYLQLQLAGEKNEIFTALFMDTRHRVISFERLFQGTIDGSAVHPRVVVQKALELNAAAVILAHNHPSGIAEPSQADVNITERLKKALALIDVRVLDHIVVTGDDSVSLAERGEL